MITCVEEKKTSKKSYSIPYYYVLQTVHYRTNRYMLWFKFSFGAKFLKLVQVLFSFVVYSLP